MSLPMRPLDDIPEQTYRVARAAFPKGNPYIVLRNQLGAIFINEEFADLYATQGQPAWAPWRLALITILQFQENLSDRQTADAVRSRIDWKYLLGLELENTGFDFSVLSEFRGRLILGSSKMLLLNRLLERCQELELIKIRGKQRTDATRSFLLRLLYLQLIATSHHPKPQCHHLVVYPHRDAAIIPNIPAAHCKHGARHT